MKNYNMTCIYEFFITLNKLLSPGNNGRGAWRYFKVTRLMHREFVDKYGRDDEA